MFDLSSILVGTAMAADVAAPVGEATVVSELMRFMPLALIFAVVYFLMIRPQQKKLDESMSMMKALKKGDKVVTAAGFIGTITKVDGDDYLMVEIADGVQVKTARSTITGLYKDKA